MTISRSPFWRRFFFGSVALGVLVFDQTTKWMAVSHLTQAFSTEPPAVSFSAQLQRFLWLPHPARKAAVEVFDHFWHMRYVENPGAAWGFLSGSASALRTPFFLAISLLAMGFILLYFWRTTPEQKALRLGLSMVLGGALGNFADRVRLGYVIDFIDWHYYDKAAWPTFNVADAAITTGVGILLLDMFFDPSRK